MTIEVNAPFQVGDTLRNLIDEKLSKLATYFEKIESVTIFFRDLDGSSHNTPMGNQAEIKLTVPGQVLFAEETSESYEKSLIAAAEKMRKQLLRYKDQISTHN